MFHSTAQGQQQMPAPSTPMPTAAPTTATTADVVDGSPVPTPLDQSPAPNVPAPIPNLPPAPVLAPLRTPPDMPPPLIDAGLGLI